MRLHTDVSGMNPAQIELIKAMYLAGIPQDLHEKIDFQVVNRPPSHSARMLYHIRREHEERESGCRQYYRPRQYGKRLVEDES